MTVGFHLHVSSLYGTEEFVDGTLHQKYDFFSKKVGYYIKINNTYMDRANCLKLGQE